MLTRRKFTQASAFATNSLGLWSATSPLFADQSDSKVQREVLRVGKGRRIATVSEAASLAGVNAVIEVDAGTYIDDVAVWLMDRVTVRAVGGRVRMISTNAAAEGKGIWVVRAQGMQVEGFSFEGAAVPSRNGAGIRLDRGSLLVRACSFKRNEMGLLTNNDPHTALEIDNCEFANNHRPDGHNHNLYAGQIAKLTVKNSYFHHARTGHLLKSRAAESHIVDNRITDEVGGSASYELEFPNGGMAHVRGNLIAQNLTTENDSLISFGAEGYKWPRNEIHLEGNTLVNPLVKRGTFLKVAPGADLIRTANNRLVGDGALANTGDAVHRNNVKIDLRDFVNAQPGSPHNPTWNQRTFAPLF